MKSILKNLDAIQVTGFSISLIVSLALIFTTDDTIPSVILGFVLAILTQLFDIQKRQNDNHEKILIANALSHELYKDEWLLERIQQIITDYVAVKQKWYEGFKIRAKDAINESHDIVHTLAEGHMIVGDKSPYSFGVMGINYAKSTLKAVTLSDNKFWGGVNGENYLEANKAAINRGVKITRIFLNSAETLEEMKNIIKKQHDMGIDVYILTDDSIAKQFHDDIIIMDDMFVNKAEFTARGRVVEWRMSIEPTKVEQSLRKFNAITRSARKPDWLLEK